MSQSPWTQRGDILFELGRYAEAENSYRQALSDDPLDPYPHYLLALCQLNQNRPAPAHTSIDRALSLDPSRASFHALRALILSYLGHPAEAIASSDEAISTAPASDYVFTLRADMFVVQSRWHDAELAARRALEINPDNTEAANQLILALREQRRLSESAQQARLLLAIEPDNARNQETSAWVALEQGRHREAEQQFTEALRLDPNRPFAPVGLKRTLKEKLSPFRIYRTHPRLTRLSIYCLLLLSGISLIIYPASPLTRPFFWLCIVGLWITIFGHSLGTSLRNLILWLNPKSRWVLASKERWGSLLVCATSLLSIATLLASIQFGSHLFIGTCLLLHGTTFCFGQAFKETQTPDGFLAYIIIGLTDLAMTLIALSIGIPASFN